MLLSQLAIAMVIDRLLAWLPLVILLAMLVLSRLRAIAMHRRGLKVIVWNLPWSEYLYDKLLALVFVFWLYLLLAEAGPLSLDWISDWLAAKLIDNVAAKSAGAILLIAAPILFGAAVTQLGTSWRMGVDRRDPGPLVTTGLFARSRNPIYAAFDLAFLGAFLIHGRVVFLVLAIALILLLHGIIRREERFLAERFGQAYRDYCARTPRYGIPGT